VVVGLKWDLWLGWLSFIFVTMLVMGCEPQVKIASEGCAQCHQVNDDLDQGIEIAHIKQAISCVECHAGDPTASERGSAHVQEASRNIPMEALVPSDVTTEELEYLAFINPTNYHTVDRACGSCHGQLVARSKRSMHATIAGLINVPRFEMGVKAKRPPNQAIVATTNDDFIPSIAPRFTYKAQGGLGVPDITQTSTSAISTIVDYTLSKACSSCHLWSAGPSSTNKDGLYRGSGCSACHFEYNNKAESNSADPNASAIDRPVPNQHVLVRNPSDSTCQSCHNTSNRIGLSYFGIREARQGEDLSQAVVNSSTMLGYEPGTLVIDEDGGDPTDSTPPDVHQSRGMRCVDCHFGNDVHGDGHIRPNMASATGIECEDCHGSAVSAVSLNEEGMTVTSAGNAFPYYVVTDETGVEKRNEDGGFVKKQRLRIEGTQVILTTLDGKERQVPQLVTRLGSRPSQDAHSLNNHGDLECYACHTSWMPNHYLTELTIDLRASSLHPITGKDSLGTLTRQPVLLGLNELYLGINVDGKIGTFMVDNQMITVLAPCSPDSVTPCDVDEGTLTPARKILNKYVGRSSEGRTGFSWRPSFAHTTATAQNTRRCETCHLLSGDRNLAKVREVFGFGASDTPYTFEDPSTGKTYNLTQFVDEAGTSTVSLGTLLARPIPPQRLQRRLKLETP